ncbi:hypothetical protein KKF84_05720, partial [Myxococcota bacterium]|nr:hypothetical protein [Myxococcota bacterium]
ITDLGGPSFLRAVIASESSGFEALVDSADWPMEELFFDWLVTLVVDNRGLTTDSRYSYNAITDDPVTGNEIGVITNGVRTDTYGTAYTFTGPARSPLVANPAQDTVTATSARFHALFGYAGELPVTLTHTGENMGLGVIRIPSE